MSKYFKTDPIIIGGVGGSGTRIVTEIIKEAGIFIGTNLNVAFDNLDIAVDFPNFRDSIQQKGSYYIRVKRKFWNFRKLGAISTPQIISKSLNKFEKKMFDDRNLQQESFNGWGWKIPGNFFIMVQLVKQFPEMKYIHTIRNGLDMAFSKNQNQKKNWGKYYGVDSVNISQPKASFQYWYYANTQAISQAEQLLKDRFLLIQFEKLCLNPQQEVERIIDFLTIDTVPAPELVRLVKHKQQQEDTKIKI